MAMNEENPYRSPESTVEERHRSPLREPLRTINHVLNALWGAIFGAVVGVQVVSTSIRGASWLQGPLMLGCIAVGAVAGVWIGRIVRNRSRLPRFRVGRHENTRNRPD